MLTQQQIEAIILYHLYGESEAAARRFRDAVGDAAKEIAAQQNMPGDSAKSRCEFCHWANGKHHPGCPEEETPSALSLVR